MSPTVSNDPLSNYTVASETWAGEEHQKMLLEGQAHTTETDARKVTAQPFDRSQIALDTSPQFEYSVQTGLAQTSNGTTTVINVASHSALRGDRIVCFTGTNASQSATVLETTATTITVAQPFSAATQAGDTYNVFRPIRARTSSDGVISATIPGGLSITGPLVTIDPIDQSAVATGVLGQFTYFLSEFYSPWLLPVAGFDTSTLAGHPLPLTNGGQDVSVAVSDGAGNSLTSDTTAPSGTERGLHVRQVGSVAATQSGTWDIRQITTSVTPGTAATNLGKAIDSPLGATDTGVAALMQRFDSPTTLTPANLDYAVPRLDSLGRQWVIAVQSGSWTVTSVPSGTQTTSAAAITWGAVTRTTTVAAVAATAAALNASRRALSLWNESGGALHWTFNGTASSTNYQGILYSGDGLMFEGNTNSTQALSVISPSSAVTYTISEAT